MDLSSGKLIAWNTLHETPVTDIVIFEAVETMAHDSERGFKILKFKSQGGVIFHDADWIAGADCNDNNNDEERHHKAKDDEELEEEEHLDPDKVGDITSDAKEDVNPTAHEVRKISRNNWQHQTTKKMRVSRPKETMKSLKQRSLHETLT